MSRLGRWKAVVVLAGLCFVAVVLFGTLLGGSGTPSPQDDQPVFVNFTNSADTSHTLELWTGEGTELDGIRVHRSTGGDYNTTAGTAGISTSHPGDTHTVMSLSFPDEVDLYGRYTLDPGATRTWTMAEPYSPTVYVIVVYTDDHVRAWKSVSCDDDVLYGFKTEVTSDGVPGAYNC